MAEKWFWLPDWASDLSLWEDDLVEAEPSADHTFVPYGEMACSLEQIYKIDGLLDADTVVGWGLGALALLKNVSSRPQNQKWILMSPFADFCGEDGYWTEQNLLFMARQTQTSAEPSIKAFMELFVDEFGEWQDDWAKCAKKMPAKALSDGLAYLAKNRIEEEITGCENIKILYGRLNQTIKPSMTLALKEFMPKAEFKERPKAGHWPPMLIL